MYNRNCAPRMRGVCMLISCIYYNNAGIPRAHPNLRLYMHHNKQFNHTRSIRLQRVRVYRLNSTIYKIRRLIIVVLMR